MSNGKFLLGDFALKCVLLMLSSMCIFIGFVQAWFGLRCFNSIRAILGESMNSLLSIVLIVLGFTLTKSVIVAYSILFSDITVLVFMPFAILALVSYLFICVSKAFFRLNCGSSMRNNLKMLWVRKEEQTTASFFNYRLTALKCCELTGWRGLKKSVQTVCSVKEKVLCEHIVQTYATKWKLDKWNEFSNTHAKIVQYMVVRIAIRSIIPNCTFFINPIDELLELFR